MAKVRSEYICQNCGAKSAGYLGRCSQCGQFGTLVETLTEEVEAKTKPKIKREGYTIQRLDQIKSDERTRTGTGFSEFDRVLGGGLVSGSVILMAGDPGIGKSTLLLQAALKLAGSRPTVHRSSKREDVEGRESRTDNIVLYVSGEESAQQIKIRSDRLDNISKDNLMLLCETDIEKIVGAIEQTKPTILIVDSIQTIEWDKLSGTAGSVGQVRECARILHKLAKKEEVSTFLVGHVTKEGVVAGPRVLEHLVDVVLYLEGDQYHNFRILRSIKNRFGSVSEVGVFEMKEKGLAEVENPSQLFLSQRRTDSWGSCVVPTIQGTRPILAEIQALASPSPYPMPKRSVQGLDFRRLEMILAVLANRLRLPLATSDIFVNVAGGLKIEEPACDLAIALAIYSALKKKAIGKNQVFFGEVGLLGEVRQVADYERRISEAKKFGLKFIFGPPQIKTLEEAVNIAFRN
jgi:DNA repair protein RadA/Sms